MGFFLWVKHDGGCDYTIGCGEKLVGLNSPTLREARKEALTKMGELVREEFSLIDASILDFVEDFMPTYCSRKSKEEQRKAEELANARKTEIASLKKRLSELEGENNE